MLLGVLTPCSLSRRSLQHLQFQDSGVQKRHGFANHSWGSATAVRMPCMRRPSRTSTFISWCVGALAGLRAQGLNERPFIGALSVAAGGAAHVQPAGDNGKRDHLHCLRFGGVGLAAVFALAPHCWSPQTPLFVEVLYSWGEISRVGEQVCKGLLHFANRHSQFEGSDSQAFAM